MIAVEPRAPWPWPYTWPFPYYVAGWPPSPYASTGYPPAVRYVIVRRRP